MCVSGNFSSLSTCDFQQNSDQISVFFLTLARFQNGNFFIFILGGGGAEFGLSHMSLTYSGEMMAR